jgi:uncharacterized protein (TIGR00297 family)
VEVVERALLGSCLAFGIAEFSVRRKMLTRGGAVAATGIGTLSMAAGWSWAWPLLAFFFSVTSLTRWRASEKGRVMADIVEKAGSRDAMQVIANGGVFAACATAFLLDPSASWRMLGTGALAAVTADSWATEVGAASGTQPRSVRGTRVPVGTSGAVTPAGLLAMVAGALFLAAFSPFGNTVEMAALAAGGIGGAFVDTLAGASLQEVRWCDQCGRETERAIHPCGMQTRHHRGIRHFTNDAVNLTSSIAGALFAWLCWRAWT